MYARQRRANQRRHPERGRDRDRDRERRKPYTAVMLHAVRFQVQDGTYVSSMVEDASFLVHKSLRRSVSTRSEQAIMAVCNRVTEVRLARG